MSFAFAWHAVFLEVVRDRYNESVWSLRDFVRHAELARQPTQAFKPEFVHLHEIARHLFHSNETLDVAVDTIRRLLASYLRLCPLEKRDDPALLSFHDRVSALEKDVQGIKRRSESLTERLQNEISLAYNLVAQRDNQILVQMGVEAHEDNKIMVQMGERARQDNNNMKLIAVVGLLYLPGTFVSSLFGMNFFSFGEDDGMQRWQVSEKFWLYWAITAPLTFCTVLIWALANYREVAKR
ncbi:hypothetical protein AA0121_g13295 [Alternaria tenuissima]|nr:hypothetical protein AA0121_g13295 [Alternaria tenuissima]